MIKKLLLISAAIFSVGISADELNSGDTAWILTSTALVLFMTLPGLSLFYAGLVRSKNAISVLMQCFAIACIVSVAWVVYGYSLAFTEGNAFIGGTSAFFLSGIGRDTLAPGTTMPHSLFVIFQMTFAIITPALVVGAFAERMKFGAMCLFSLLWFTAVYIPACHMIWGGGYLGDVKDFAGGLVVHLTCGVGALVIAVVLGPRKGFPSTAMPPHNRTMVVTGAAMLWVGWFGFNAGSSWAADGLAGMAMGSLWLQSSFYRRKCIYWWYQRILFERNRKRYFSTRYYHASFFIRNLPNDICNHYPSSCCWSIC